MRTTLDLDDDLLMATKEIARRERTSAGKVVSRLLRQALSQPASRTANPAKASQEAFCGFEPFASRDGLVTNEMVEKLREEEGI